MCWLNNIKVRMHKKRQALFFAITEVDLAVNGGKTSVHFHVCGQIQGTVTVRRQLINSLKMWQISNTVELGYNVMKGAEYFMSL
jgi:hypothetical protein